MTLALAQRSLNRLREWSGDSEMDLYPYVKDFFCHVLGYPAQKVRLGQPGEEGFPDVSLCSQDLDPKEGVFWLVAEVKAEKGRFLNEEERNEVWSDQLERYVSADTVYALLVDPHSLAVLRPNGTLVKAVDLTETSVEELTQHEGVAGLAFLGYEASVSEEALEGFKLGEAPSRYLDVKTDAGRSRFYDALRISSQELIDYASARLQGQLECYTEYEEKLQEVNDRAVLEDDLLENLRNDLRRDHHDAVELVEKILPDFEDLIGRQLPSKEGEAKRFLHDVYATEGSSLVLARVLFIRFCEEHKLTTRKISNGGIRQYREFFEYLKDDYRNLLQNAYRDVERVYARLFEPSIFDWTHEGDGSLSRILLRIFYRMNAFDFTKITGDILGNLYERFLDPEKRKRLGEYYTPMELAEYVLDRIGFYENPGKLLDPACGSGTFLIAAATGLIDRLLKRGISKEESIMQVLKLIHGLDINVFAAFIAQLQLLWHIFPYLEDSVTGSFPDTRVYGGVNSLIYRPQRTLQDAVLRPGIQEAEKIRDGRYKYVVGNPPYIRNERLKDRGKWRNFYSEVDYRNSDIAFFFLQRAFRGGRANGDSMPAWLEEGGRMCFVLPKSIGDSAAAEKLRERLYENRILEITDLGEIAVHLFPSPQASSRGTVVPMLLFVERTKSIEDEDVEMVITREPSMSQSVLERSSIPKSAFTATTCNPYKQIPFNLRVEDIPILEKLYKQEKVGTYASKPTPTYGVKRGGKGVIMEREAEGLLPIYKGQTVSAFYLVPKPSGWVDMDSVESQSMWSHRQLLSRPAYALSEIALTCHSCIFDPNAITFNNSAVLFVPESDSVDFPWDVLFNSSITRYVHSLTLRAGLIDENRSHTYPRIISALPVPSLLVEDPSPILEVAGDLRKTSRNIGHRWEDLEQSIAKAEKATLPILGVDLTNWKDPPATANLRLVRKKDLWRLQVFAKNQATLSYIEGPREILGVAKYLVEVRGVPLARSNLEKLEVPKEAKSIFDSIDRTGDSNSPDIQMFKELHSIADKVLAKAFGLNKKELEYVYRRLSDPPLDSLVPRWPWVTAEQRSIQTHEGVDRFA
jgi:hypothetical protein